MTEPGNTNTKSTASSMKMLRAMVGIGVTSALLIVLAFELTLPRVEKLKAEALEKAILDVLPGTDSTRVLGITADGKLIESTEDADARYTVYAGYDKDQNLVGYAIEAAGMGYADVIRILYGYDPKIETVIGFRVLESKETPGLGDKIEKEPHFLENFTALDVSVNDGKLKNQVTTVKQGEKQHAWEVEGISGATISSRAVGDMMSKNAAEVIPVLQENYKKP